jgi:hypothetical protein
MGDSLIARAIVEGMAMAELLVAAQPKREQGRRVIAWLASIPLAARLLQGNSAKVKLRILQLADARLDRRPLSL